jgi:CheY-like chemotaxis protein
MPPSGSRDTRQSVNEIAWYRDLQRPLRLLLVEDNPADVRLLDIALAKGPAKCEIHVATDGEQALQFLFAERRPEAAQRPDLILLDLNLPRLNGQEVLQRIKKDRHLCTIPVVVFTSSQLPSDILTAYKHGANSYLPKPKGLDELLDLVRTLEHYWLDLALLPGPSAGNTAARAAGHS